MAFYYISIAIIQDANKLQSSASNDREKCIHPERDRISFFVVVENENSVLRLPCKCKRQSAAVEQIPQHAVLKWLVFILMFFFRFRLFTSKLPTIFLFRYYYFHISHCMECIPCCYRSSFVLKTKYFFIPRVSHVSLASIITNKYEYVFEQYFHGSEHGSRLSPWNRVTQTAMKTWKCGPFQSLCHGRAKLK